MRQALRTRSIFAATPPSSLVPDLEAMSDADMRRHAAIVAGQLEHRLGHDEAFRVWMAIGGAMGGPGGRA